MKIAKTLLRVVLLLLSIPLLYLIVAVVLTYIPIQAKEYPNPQNNIIYLTTNGVHLDIVIPVNKLSNTLKTGLQFKRNERYLSFGWGDKDFYLNTEEWEDLTVGNAMSALFLKSETLMHVTRFKWPQKRWKKVSISDHQMQLLNDFIQNSFELDPKNKKSILIGQGYSTIDDFYKAQGSYSCLYTCNTWVNSALKNCGLKACLWTPFDFGVMNKY